MKLPNIIDRSNIIKSVAYGTLLLNILLFGLLLNSFFVDHHEYVIDRILIVAACIAYSVLCLLLFRHKLYVLASIGIILYYLAGATFIAATWGINMPFSILLYCFVILLSSFMLGPKYVIPTTALIVFALFICQLLTKLNILVIDTSQLGEPSSFSDVATYAIIFGVFSILGWTSGNKLEVLISDLSKAQEILTAQNNSIKNELEEEKRRLRIAQIDELVTLQQFADLGQNTSMILHELSNQLAVITLDDEGTPSKDKKRDLDETIKDLQQLIKNANDKLKPHNAKSFRIDTLLESHLKKFSHNSKTNRIKLIFINKSRQHSLHTYGDPHRLQQIITILINNAFESYSNKKIFTKRAVIVTCENHNKQIRIKIQDFGKGISLQQRKDLFKNIKSSKPHGHGIGLYVARHMIESHFKGSLELESALHPTTFMICLPVHSS